MDVAFALLLGEKVIKKRGGLGEGGSKIGPKGTLADDGKRNEVYGMEWTVHFEYNYY